MRLLTLDFLKGLLPALQAVALAADPPRPRFHLFSRNLSTNPSML